MLEHSCSPVSAPRLPPAVLCSSLPCPIGRMGTKVDERQKFRAGRKEERSPILLSHLHIRNNWVPSLWGAAVSLNRAHLG